MNISEFRYRLDKTRGTSTKITCPYCGRKKSFRLYIDQRTGEPVDERCGRCDHEHTCGENVTPHKFFAENPDYRSRSPSYSQPVTKKEPPEEVEVTLPMSMVDSHLENDDYFVPWLRTVIGDDERVGEVIAEYKVGSCRPGVYKTRPVIFWFIDRQGIVHDGKIMWYKADGHRKEALSWVSYRLVQSNKLPVNAVTRKCLFGEHLLSQYPEKSVALVESEKSALVCACLHPDYLWLATGGCGGLTKEKMAVLRGRRVLIFPDSGKLHDWRMKLHGITDAEIIFVEELEKYSPNTDIVDLLLDEAIPITQEKA